MPSPSRLLLRLFLASPLLLAAVQAQAQALTVSFDGQIFSCTDPAQNTPLVFSFSTDGQASGADTLIQVTLPAPLGTFTVPVPTATIDALAAASAGLGQNVTVQIPSTDVGDGCLLEGTLTLSVSGSGEGSLNPALEAGNEITTPAELDAFLRGQPTANSRRIRAVLQGRGNTMTASNGGLTVSGLAAGNGAAPALGAWMGYSYTDTRNDFATTAFSADRHGVLVGIDAMPGENWLLGVSFGLERARIQTRFNGGEQEVTGMTLAPYVGVLLDDWLTVDASFGWSDLSMDQFRTVGAARVTSDVESSRLFANVNLSASHAFDRLLLTGQGGLLWATQRDDDFLESNGTVNPDGKASVGRLLLGGELAYTAGAFEPYVSGMLGHDFSKTSQAFAAGVARPKDDDTDVLLSVGLRYFGRDGLSGSVEYGRLLGRTNLDEDTLSANVRWAF